MIEYNWLDHLPVRRNMNLSSVPASPREYAETLLLEAILDGTYSPGSQLPGERVLAAQLGITRPTLREVIQRLARDGWLTVSQGKRTIVNNFWEEGGLNVLNKLVEHQSHLPPDFVLRVLDIRLLLAPAYTRAAVERAGEAIAVYLAQASVLEDVADAYARYDWLLHRLLTIYSQNPIFTLILNGFRDFYEDLGRLYFDFPEARRLSSNYYVDLHAAAIDQNSSYAEQLCREAMMTSIRLWHRIHQDSHD
jgi:GntR family transcriptional regulator, negative regulator for fad regulon and positive regulator of fabA